MAKPPAKRPIGQPPKFGLCTQCNLPPSTKCPADPERPDQKCLTYPAALTQLVSNGVSLKAACGISGVSFATLQKWRHRGEDALATLESGEEIDDNDSQYVDFLHQFIKASNTMQATLENNLGRKVKSGELTVGESIKILERIDRTRWGASVSVEHSGSVEMNVVNRYADTIADLLQGIMRGLRLTPEQHELARTVIPLELARVTQTEDQDVIDA